MARHSSSLCNSGSSLTRPATRAPRSGSISSLISPDTRAPRSVSALGVSVNYAAPTDKVNTNTTLAKKFSVFISSPLGKTVGTIFCK
jgi:hypothetical protein